jgi:anti-sigma-K factor RskA
MTKHLTPREVVDALDGTLALARQAHLDTCGTCARAVDALRSTQGDVADGGEIPEPSPLFWTHFSERVREATRETPIERAPWWSRFWQPVVAVGAVAAVALMVMTVSRTSEAPVAPVVATAAADSTDVLGLDNDAWALMLEIAGSVPVNDDDFDAIVDVAMPRPGTADRMIEALTPEQREAFIKLLKSEMGTLE